MCNCLDVVLNKVSENLKQKKEVLDFTCDWKGKVLRFDGGCGVGLYIEREYRSIKKDGTPFSNKTKSEHFVALSYCPFCGQKIEKEK